MHLELVGCPRVLLLPLPGEIDRYLSADHSCKIVISYWLNFGVSYTNSDVVWRFPIAFQILFALIIIVGMIFLPESPRWYVHFRVRFETSPTDTATYRLYPRTET